MAQEFRLFGASRGEAFGGAQRYPRLHRGFRQAALGAVELEVFLRAVYFAVQPEEQICARGVGLGGALRGARPVNGAVSAVAAGYEVARREVAVADLVESPWQTLSPCGSDSSFMWRS